MTPDSKNGRWITFPWCRRNGTGGDPADRQQYNHVKAQLFARMWTRSSSPLTQEEKENWWPAGSWTVPAAINLLNGSGSLPSPTKPSGRDSPHLKEGRQYDPLYHAARSRAEADWLVGINATGPSPASTMPSFPAEGTDPYPGHHCPAGGRDPLFPSPGILWPYLPGRRRHLDLAAEERRQHPHLPEGSLTELEQRLKGQSLTVTDIQRSSRKTFPQGSMT